MFQEFIRPFTPICQSVISLTKLTCVNYRKENDTKPRAMIWKFKNTKKLKISKMTVKVNSATFETGRVLWTLCAGEFCTRLKSGENQVRCFLALI